MLQDAHDSKPLFQQRAVDLDQQLENGAVLPAVLDIAEVHGGRVCYYDVVITTPWSLDPVRQRQDAAMDGAAARRAEGVKLRRYEDKAQPVAFEIYGRAGVLPAETAGEAALGTYLFPLDF